MQITPSNLIRWAGLSAVAGGALFVAIQPIHPPEILSSFTTSTWAIVHYVGVIMCFLILLGIAGIYARQVKEAGLVWPAFSCLASCGRSRRPFNSPKA
jgi:hypothetical protein